MRKLAFSILLLLLAGSGWSQTYFKFAVFFRDKDLVTYSTEQPEVYLSQRSIDRRDKMGIAVTEQDIPVNPAYVSDVLALSGVEYCARSKWMNYVIIGTFDSSVVTTINAFGFVDNSVLIYKGEKPAKKAYSPPSLAKTGTSLSDIDINQLNYGRSDDQNKMIGIDYLHRKNYLGQGMVIAVLDAGFSNVDAIPAFEHLFNDSRLLGTWDFVRNESSVYEDNNHGCNVLSTMAGFLPDKFMGTAPGASYYLLRSEDAATETVSEEYNWVAAAEYADSVGADVINSSLGYTTFDNPSQDHTYIDLNGNTTVITRGADMAASKGILVVNSAGNSGNNAWKYLGAPSDGDSVLAIAAVDIFRNIAGFSSWGPSSDGRIKPNVAAVGQGTAVVSPSGDIYNGNGTSFSGPVIAGAVAVLWQAHYEKSNMEIFHATEQCSHLADNPDDRMGYGIPNFGLADLILSNTDIDTYYENQSLKILPNPVGDQEFIVEFMSAEKGPITLSIANMRGKVLFQQEYTVYGPSVNQFPISITKKMASGTYVCTIVQGAYRFSSKLVKS